MPQYPPFIPPGELGEGNRREWSAKQAKEYFEWLTDQVIPRTDTLLAYFGEDYAQEPEELLNRLGRKVGVALRGELQFSTRDGDRPKLTDRGYALAADLGLLIARLVIERGPQGLHWVVLRKPKSDISYNLPILEGVGAVTFEPVGAAIAEAYGVLRGDRADDTWLLMYQSVLERALDSSSLRIAEGPGAIKSQSRFR